MSGPAALSSALTGDVGVTPRLAARARAPTARRGGRSPGARRLDPSSLRRRRRPRRRVPRPRPRRDRPRRARPRALPSHRPGSLLVARAAPSEDDDTPWAPRRR